MKKLITTIFIIIMFWGEFVFSQSYNVKVLNQHVEENDFIFDIFIMLNDTADFYLGGSDFSLHFNSTNFSNPAASVQISEEVEHYTSAISILNSNVIVLNILPPFFLNQEEFETMSAKINLIEPGTKVAEIRISNIVNFSGDTGLTWKEQIPNQCVLYSIDKSSPWLTTEKTLEGEFISPTSTPLPVELSSFTSVVKANSVELNWTTETEINNYGFEVERKVGSWQSAVGNWEMTGFINGSGNSNSQKQYSFTDINLSSGKYFYRLKQIDNEGTFSFSEVIGVQVIEVPNTFILEQNYPNPFNPITKIRWQSPVGSWQTLKIYDVLGNEVIILVDEFREAGRYEIEFDASLLASGMFVYKLTATPNGGQAGNFTSIKKMLLIK